MMLTCKDGLVMGLSSTRYGSSMFLVRRRSACAQGALRGERTSAWRGVAPVVVQARALSHGHAIVPSFSSALSAPRSYTRGLTSSPGARGALRTARFDSGGESLA